MAKTSIKKSLLDAYKFDGFKTMTKIKEHKFIQDAFVLTLVRRQKKLFAEHVVKLITSDMIKKINLQEIFLLVIIRFSLSLKYREFFVENVNP